MSENEQELNKAIETLGLDKDQVTDEAFINYKQSSDVTNKVTAIRNIAMSFRMVLEGKAYDEEKGGYKQTDKSIAGKHFISLTYGILNSYAEDSNLLTTKDFDKFGIQFVDAFRKIENLSLRDRSISERDQRTILKMFKDSLMNIGDIITGSKDNMERVFNRVKEEEITKELDKGF